MLSDSFFHLILVINWGADKAVILISTLQLLQVHEASNNYNIQS